MKIVAVCDSKECATLLEDAGKELNFKVVCEVQNGLDINNEIDESEIRLSNAVLFAIDGEVEHIAKIERFIDCEYYEVESKFVVDNAKNVLLEIASDIN